MKTIFRWPLILAPLLAAACATGGDTGAADPAQANTIRGTVSPRDSAPLPAGATVDVRMLDLRRRDAPVTVARTSFAVEGRPTPLAFELRFDPAGLDRSRPYAVRATIQSEGRVLFATESAQPVLTQGNPVRADLRLARAPDPAAVPDLRGTSWLIEDLAGSGAPGRVDATLQFSDDGNVSGHNACNRFNGPVTIKGQSIAFGALATTRMACVRELTDFETRYMRALQQADWFESDGKVLLIYAREFNQPIRYLRRRQ